MPASGYSDNSQDCSAAALSGYSLSVLFGSSAYPAELFSAVETESSVAAFSILPLSDSGASLSVRRSVSSFASPPFIAESMGEKLISSLSGESPPNISLSKKLSSIIAFLNLRFYVHYNKTLQYTIKNDIIQEKKVAGLQNESYSPVRRSIILPRFRHFHFRHRSCSTGRSLFPLSSDMLHRSLYTTRRRPLLRAAALCRAA